MEKLHWPRPAGVVGIGVGAFSRKSTISRQRQLRLAWTWRPGVLIIFAVTLVGILYPLIKKKREGEDKSNRRDYRSKPTPKEASSSAGQLFLPVALSSLALALWQSRNFGVRAGLFPG